MTTLIRKTTCPLDCPDSCALDVTVEEGRVVKIEGRADHPVTAGYICRKVRHFHELAYGPERLRTPARRIGPKGAGKFEPISWDEAFDQIVEAIRAAVARHGSESILPFCYGGSNGKLSHDAMDARFFRRLGASRLARTVCAAPTGRVATEMYGKMHGVAYEDYAAASLVVIWGANPQASGIHLIPFLRAARDRGAKLVVIDPRSTPLARQADLHLAIRPGTDVAVALGIINWLFAHQRVHTEFLARNTTGADRLRDRAAEWPLSRAAETAGVSVDALERLAEWYAAAEPAVIRCGWGVERARSAGSSVAAILALPAVAGKFGVRGGGYTLSNSGAWKFAQDDVIGLGPTSHRLINMNQLGRTLLEENAPPIDVLFVYNCNPLATMPNQEKVRAGLSRNDLFTVVFEQVMNDTARYADILLPATTFLEHHDLRAGYGNSELRMVLPVIDRIGQARTNHEVFGELCRRMQLQNDGDVVDRAAWCGRLVQDDPTGGEVVARLEAGEAITPSGGARPIQFVDIFPATPDGKIHLFPESLEREAPEGLYRYLAGPSDPRYPLQMISPASEHLINSTLGALWKQSIPLEIHPDDARQRDLRDGDRVRVFNELGEVECWLRVTDQIRPGLVVLPKGLWSHHTLNGRTSNALAPDDLTDLAGGACFNETRVEVVRA